MHPSVPPAAICKWSSRLSSLALVRQPILEKENSEVLLRYVRRTIMTERNEQMTHFIPIQKADLQSSLLYTLTENEIATP